MYRILNIYKKSIENNKNAKSHLIRWFILGNFIKDWLYVLVIKEKPLNEEWLIISSF